MCQALTNEPSHSTRGPLSSLRPVDEDSRKDATEKCVHPLIKNKLPSNVCCPDCRRLNTPSRRHMTPRPEADAPGRRDYIQYFSQRACRHTGRRSALVQKSNRSCLPDTHTHTHTHTQMHAHTLRQGWLAVLKHFIMCVQTKIYTSSCPLSRGHTGHVTTCIMEVSHISTCWLQRTPACDWLQGINHSNETRKRSQNDSHACEAAGRLRPLLLVGVINSVSTQEADRLNMYDNNPDVLCVQSVHM